MTLEIRTCPSCGGNHVKSVVLDFEGEVGGKAYRIPALECHECPDCGERIYAPEAMRRIQAASPAFKKPHAHKRPRIPCEV